MRDRINLRIIELQREMKAEKELLNDLNQTDGTYRRAHVRIETIKEIITELINISL